MIKDYGLSFISNEDLFFHVKESIGSEQERKVTLSKLKNTGCFHQSILKSIIENKVSLSKGFDIINKDKKIFAEVKSKCLSMNAASARNTYMQMQYEILSDRSTTCYLVEILAEPNQYSLWKITLDGQKLYHENIRRISLNQFYKKITGISSSFEELCHALPKVFDDVLAFKNQFIQPPT